MTREIKYIVPLIFIFTFLKVKAEFFNSAFTDFLYYEVDSTLIKNKILLAEKLYKDANYTKSLELTYSVLSSGKIEDKLEANLLLGKIFEKTNRKQVALSHFKKTLKLFDKLFILEGKQNPFFLNKKAETLLNLGGIYLMEGKIDSSAFYLEKLIKVNAIDNSTISFVASGFSNLSAISLEKREYEVAKTYVKQAIKLHEIEGKTYELSIDYLNLGNIFLEKRDYLKAKETYLKALSFLQNKTEEKAIKNKEIIYYNLAWTLYLLKDYKSYEYLEKSMEIKEKLNDINLSAELKKIETVHNIDLIKKEAEYKRLKLERRNWIIAIVGILTTILLLYFINLYKLRQKNLKLQLSKNELEQQKELDKLKSESQIKIINAAIDGKETERKQIAETLHDNVSALLSSANLHLEASQKQFDGELPVELQKTQDIILEASLKIRDLSHNLISSVLLKFGLGYALKDIAKKYSNSSLQVHAITNNIDRYSQDFEIKVFNIIQELLNNVLKHSNASTAYVTLEEKNTILSIIVKDDGKGFNVGVQSKSGIGLDQIQARILVMKGEIDIDSSSQKGTKVTIDIPVVERVVG